MPTPKDAPTLCPHCGEKLEPLQQDKLDWARIANNHAHVAVCKRRPAPVDGGVSDERTRRASAPLGLAGEDRRALHEGAEAIEKLLREHPREPLMEIELRRYSRRLRALAAQEPSQREGE